MSEDIAQASQPEQTTPAVASENNAAPQVENTSEEATNSETGAADTPATETKPERKRDGGFQRRISELTRDKHELQRTIEALLARERAATAPQTTPQNAPDAAPRQEDFASYDAWQQAVIDHRVKATLEARERQTREEAQRKAAERTEAQRRASLQKAAEEAADRFPDFEDTVATADIPVTPAMVEAIDGSDRKPELLYWLAKNPAEAKRIAELGPVAQAREIARVELTKLAAQPQKAVSDAPEPPKTIAKARASNTPDPEKMTMAEYVAWRNKNGA